MLESIYLTECPRDAMQGLKNFIPTETKINYLNHLLTLGFDRLDFGSFVSEKAIPQLKDTAEVLAKLNLSSTELLAIVANSRGAEEACKHKRIAYIGYPFSVSNEFQIRNTGKTIQESLNTLKEIKSLCDQANKKLVVYLSMAFGNPYNEDYSEELVLNLAHQLHSELGIEELMLSDTIGAATPELVASLFRQASESLPSVSFGAHLHSRYDNAKGKLEAAFNAGCRKFDGALGGFGGCPMAKDELVGNMPTEIMLTLFEEHLPKFQFASFNRNETLSLSQQTMNAH